VYRLVTRETVEEDIMALQHFKSRVAAAVVNDSNSSTTGQASGGGFAGAVRLAGSSNATVENEEDD